MPKSKFFRVATEGQTTDGREIKRQWIEQAAKNYDPSKFGARVNMEHLRGLMPDGPFKMFGDVLSLEARDVEDGKKALFAQIDPTAELIDLVNTRRQKVFTSIEIDPNFAGSNEAYLVGLAVTDNPASLGTEMLRFSGNPLAARKQKDENFFSSAIEFNLQIEDQAPQNHANDFNSFLNKFMELFSKKTEPDTQQQTVTYPQQVNLSDYEKALNILATSQSDMMKTISELGNQITTLSKQNEAIATLFKKLSETDSNSQSRPTATGATSTSSITTDC